MRAVEQEIRGLEQEQWRRSPTRRSRPAPRAWSPSSSDAIGKVEATWRRRAPPATRRQVADLEENLASRRAFLEMAERASADYSRRR